MIFVHYWCSVDIEQLHESQVSQPTPPCLQLQRPFAHHSLYIVSHWLMWCCVCGMLLSSPIQIYFEDCKQHTQLHNSRLFEMVQFQFHDWNNHGSKISLFVSTNHLKSCFPTLFCQYERHLSFFHPYIAPLLAPRSPPLVNKWEVICSLLLKDGGFLPSHIFGQFFILLLCISKQQLIPPEKVLPPFWTPFLFAFIQRAPNTSLHQF